MQIASPDNVLTDSDLNYKLKINPVNVKTDYPFVDLIRFISMIGIVWAHIDLFNKDESIVQKFLTDDHYMQFYIPFKQLFKFAVICFFMISGYLLGDKIQTSNSVVYFKNRFGSTVKPYLIAFLPFLGIMVIKAYVFNHVITDTNSFASLVKYCMFQTLFWYLPNYLICLFIILLFKPYLNSIYLGLGLLLITLVYMVLNVYTITYADQHTKAMFGFVFYLWLGAYIRHNNLVYDIRKIPSGILIAITAALFVLSSLESYWLYLNKLSYFHILRIFNQLYSVSMFVLLVNLCRSKINFGPFNPRKETFGIYLYHSFFIYFIIPKVITLGEQYLGIKLYNYTTGLRLGIITLYFVACYISTVLLVKAFLRFKLAYLNF